MFNLETSRQHYLTGFPQWHLVICGSHVASHDAVSRFTSVRNKSTETRFVKVWGNCAWRHNEKWLCFKTVSSVDGNSTLCDIVSIWNILWCAGTIAKKLFHWYQSASHYLYIHDKNPFWINETAWHVPTVSPGGENITRYKVIITQVSNTFLCTRPRG
jgi:hypothetical protein